MTSKKQKCYNDFDQTHFIKLTKRRFRKKFGKKITPTEINEIWKNFVQHGIIQNVLKGDCVKIDKHSTIQVVGVVAEDDKRFQSMLRKGKMLRTDGRLVSANLKGRRSEFKYSIVYKNRLAKGEIYFKGTQNFRKQLTDTLNNTNIYFHIKQSQNSDEKLH